MFAGLCECGDWLQVEVKGADSRRIIRDSAANEQRRVLRFLDQLLRLLERHGIQLTSRIYLKTSLDGFDGTTTYSSAVQRFVETFEHRLVEASDTGIMILDSRNKGKNAPDPMPLLQGVEKRLAPFEGQALVAAP